jgi:hypothetical protein
MNNAADGRKRVLHTQRGEVLGYWARGREVARLPSIVGHIVGVIRKTSIIVTSNAS